MRSHGVRRVFAMGTISIFVEGDRFSVSRLLVVGLVASVANAAFRLIRGVGRVFEEEGGIEGVGEMVGDGGDAGGGEGEGKEEGKEGRRGVIDWTVFRIGGIPGGCDEASWRADREGEVFEGYVGEEGWSASIPRARLARWLVDAVEDRGRDENGEGMKREWVKKMPAVSRLAGGGKKTT